MTQMSEMVIFTIGHSNRTMNEFALLLQQNDISVVADVRSSPYSQHFPQFNRESLKEGRRENRIDYVFLGAELGARRSEAECYSNGVAEYERIAHTPAFKTGLERIRRGMQTHRIALLCAEKDPLACHRTILICRFLKEK